jgi:ABC-type transport system involved in cytochrome bd biosynthesis fused ATPase/permease subunit
MGTTRHDFNFEVNPPGPQFNPNIQPNETNLKPGIQIKGLTKRFGKKTAVNGLTLDMNQGQITALLGK